MIEKRQFYINGSWVDPIEGRDHHVINPSAEEAVAVISLGGKADTDAAVAAAIIGSGPLQWPFVAGSLLVAMAAHALYIKRVPPPY